MKKKTTNIFLVIAAILSIIGQIDCFFDYISFFESYGKMGLLSIAGIILFAFGLVIYSRRLSVTGLGLYILTYVYSWYIIIQKSNYTDQQRFGIYLRLAILVLGILFLIIALLSKKKRVSIIFGAAAGLTILLAPVIVTWIRSHFYFNISFETLSMPIASVLVGIGINYVRKETAEVVATIEHLSELKMLVDGKIITKSEFEEKKKRLLDKFQF